MMWPRKSAEKRLKMERNDPRTSLFELAAQPLPEPSGEGKSFSILEMEKHGK